MYLDPVGIPHAGVTVLTLHIDPQDLKIPIIGSKIKVSQTKNVIFLNNSISGGFWDFFPSW